jgi:excisionase family DNA binding protein
VRSAGTQRTPKNAPERLALSPTEAADALSMSRDSFDRYVRDDLRLVRVGRKVLVPRGELESWLERNASRPLVEDLNLR